MPISTVIIGLTLIVIALGVGIWWVSKRIRALEPTKSDPESWFT